MTILGLPYKEIWCCDFEFVAEPGCPPDVVCMVARELGSGRLIRLWRDDFKPDPPFDIGGNVLFVAYYASAEMGCFQQLGWSMPVNVLDLYTEFRCETNGLTLPHGRGNISPAAAAPDVAHQPNRWATRQHTRTDPLDCHTKGHAIERTLTLRPWAWPLRTWRKHW